MLRFKLLNIWFQIDFLFVAMITFFLLTDKTGIAVISLLACFIHESGHLIMFMAVGYTPKAMIFEFTGIRLVKPAQELKPFKDFLVQIAGSSMNFIAFIILIQFKDDSLLYLNALTHLLLGIFQLLPLDSLDGGKILKLLLCCFISEGTAQKATDITGIITVLLLCAFCGFMWFTDNGSLTLLIFSGGLMMVVYSKLNKKNFKRNRIKN